MSDTPAPPTFPPETAPRRAPMAWWRAARWFLCTLHDLFGSPSDVARLYAIRGDSHARMASWIRCAEAMLRRLLLIEAAALPKPNTRPLMRPSRQRARRFAEFWPGKPEDWRVRFRVLNLPPRRGGSAERSEAKGGLAPSGAYGASSPASGGDKRRRVSREDRPVKPMKLCDAWPLALRYEALLRVFNDPVPFARRLARRLYATPHRASEALRAPPEAQRRIDDFEALTELAVTPWRERRSSA